MSINTLVKNWGRAAWSVIMIVLSVQLRSKKQMLNLSSPIIPRDFGKSQNLTIVRRCIISPFQKKKIYQ